VPFQQTTDPVEKSLRVRRVTFVRIHRPIASRANSKLSKTILGCEISKEQAQKLLTTGKTDLLEGFISKRGRPFSAYLKLEDGKVGFEFPEKPARTTEAKEAQTS